MNFFVVVMFLVAGLLVGGAYAAYQAANKLAFWGLAALAIISLAAAVAWLISGIQSV